MYINNEYLLPAYLLLLQFFSDVLLLFGLIRKSRPQAESFNDTRQPRCKHARKPFEVRRRAGEPLIGYKVLFPVCVTHRNLDILFG